MSHHTEEDTLFDEKFGRVALGYGDEASGTNRKNLKTYMHERDKRTEQRVVKLIEDFEIHAGIHGEYVENPLMHLSDMKRFLLERIKDNLTK